MPERSPLMEESDRCDWIQTRFDITGVDSYTVLEGESISCECLRPSGHAGPHLIQRLPRVGGAYIIWEHDLCELGTCEFCDENDPEDYCLSYAEIKKEEAVLFINDETKEM
jgi:hypothetical protein